MDEAGLSDGDVTVAVAWSSLNYKDALAICNKSPVVRSWPMVAPPARRRRAWDRLARDLDPALLETMIEEVRLEDVIAKAQDLMAGRVRGRVVVRIAPILRPAIPPQSWMRLVLVNIPRIRFGRPRFPFRGFQPLREPHCPPVRLGFAPAEVMVLFLPGLGDFLERNVAAVPFRPKHGAHLLSGWYVL